MVLVQSGLQDNFPKQFKGSGHILFEYCEFEDHVELLLVTGGDMDMEVAGVLGKFTTHLLVVSLAGGDHSVDDVSPQIEPLQHLVAYLGKSEDKSVVVEVSSHLHMVLLVVLAGVCPLVTNCRLCSFSPNDV